MRKNYFLRTALCLFAGALASVYLLAGTGTWAKYVATGKGGDSAKVATFSFLTSGQKYLGNGVWGDADNSEGDITNTVQDHWTQIVTLSGINGAETFQLPLFDHQYYTRTGASQALSQATPPVPGSTLITVESANKDLIVAPGELPRADALRIRGRRSLTLALGALPLLLIVGLVEGFVSPGDLFAPAVKLALGLCLLALLVVWVLKAGRGEP